MVGTGVPLRDSGKRGIYLDRVPCFTGSMIALVLAVSTLPMAPATFQPSGSVARAEIRIRIISGASITLGQPAHDPGARVRSATVQVDGEARPARLVEFQ